MLRHCFVSHYDLASSSSYSHLLCFSVPNSRFNLVTSSSKKKPSPCLTSCVLNVGFEDIAEVIHNKVLIAAGFSAAIGQISKPYTSVVLYGKGLDFRTAFQAGGFPSTHSSSVVAAATAIGFERGFDDSIFGLTVVYAGLIMYDAQGVRREVGKHARVLNRLRTNDRIGEEMSLKSKDESKALQSGESSEEEVGSSPLKESIGHTEVEVIAGALFGFLVSFGVYTLM